MPTIFFILWGVALGPAGIDVLSQAVLDRFDLVVSVALAVAGIYVGLGLSGIPREWMRDALVGGAVASAVTIVAVTGGLFVLVASWGMRLPMDALTYAVIVGICASVSAALHTDTSPETRRAASLADADDVPLVLLGSVAVAVLAAGGFGLVVTRLVLTVGAGAAIGLAGWLLFDRASGSAERGVFVTGAVLLVAGIGTYLGTSPLLAGGIAALVWVRAPGPADRITASDLRVLQHPLVALLLICAGALIEWSGAVLWVTAAVVLLRLTGKLLGGMAVARMLQIRPGVLVTALLPPGVLGIALAVNARLVVGHDVAGIVSVVTVAAGASELIAAFLPRDVEDVR